MASQLVRPLTIPEAILLWLAEDPKARSQAALARQLELSRSYMHDILIRKTRPLPDDRIPLLPDPLCVQVAKIRRAHHLGMAATLDPIIEKRSVLPRAVQTEKAAA